MYIMNYDVLYYNTASLGVCVSCKNVKKKNTYFPRMSINPNSKTVISTSYSEKRDSARYYIIVVTIHAYFLEFFRRSIPV